MYECCDRLIESGQRPASACEPECPWERATTPFTVKVFGLFAMCSESHENPKTHEKKYGIDIVRLEFALRAHGVPRRDWLEAWHWMALIAGEANK